uniref:Pleckstrin homology domain containing B2 n=2 Tax=Rousettus aegyptiacus TaxID=9407 RepID=A0A7J8JJP2_ROUAE|nr:pleckstrin homology domain containing B2 [Rousettus aegyptiacus]
MAVVKSGWLLRQSTILKRWKKNWFDLWSDGHLIYYDDHTRQSVEDKVHMPVDCINIRTGHECRDIQPPDGKPKDCMLQIVCRDGKTISLCAESMDDCLAWKFALQDSRTNTVSCLPTKSSFVSGIKTTTLIWRWACWQEQPQAWP